MSSHARADYLFHLPEDRIAQSPAQKRDSSALLVAAAGAPIQHHRFADLPNFLRAGDLLVLNQTRVMNARCRAVKENGTAIEVFILGIQVDPARVPVLLRPAKRVKVDTRLHFPNANIWANTVEKGEMGKATLAFDSMDALLAVIEQDGELPLPPYIKREEGPDQDDRERYQTVFARDLGAVAAPTAGLHFTDQLLEQLKDKGIEPCFVTHHVGIGTFKPLVADDIRDHEMEPEAYDISERAAGQLNRAKAEGRRIIAVGTTSTRCLESNFDGRFHAGRRVTNHYIYPGYQFGAIDGLITNFHLPGSTLILLVAALMGRERIMDIYTEAMARDYRFYSYGDAMLLLPHGPEDRASEGV